MNRYVLCASVATLVSCGGDRNESTQSDMQFIRNIGHEYAATYRSMLTNGSEMDRHNFLLDVNARESQLENEIGVEFAREFRQAFADSAFVEL